MAHGCQEQRLRLIGGRRLAPRLFQLARVFNMPGDIIEGVKPHLFALVARGHKTDLQMTPRDLQVVFVGPCGVWQMVQGRERTHRSPPGLGALVFQHHVVIRQAHRAKAGRGGVDHRAAEGFAFGDSRAGLVRGLDDSPTIPTGYRPAQADQAKKTRTKSDQGAQCVTGEAFVAQGVHRHPRRPLVIDQLEHQPVGVQVESLLQGRIRTGDSLEDLPRRRDKGELVIHHPIHGALEVVGLDQVEHDRGCRLGAGAFDPAVFRRQVYGGVGQQASARACVARRTVGSPLHFCIVGLRRARAYRVEHL